MKIFNAVVVLAFCKVVVAADIDKNPAPQDQEQNISRGLYVHRIIDGVTHIDPVQSGQIIHPPSHYVPLPPPVIIYPNPIPYGHYMPAPWIPVPWHGPIVHPLPYGHHVPVPCMPFYPWLAPMFHQPMLPPPQYFGPPPPPYKEDDQQSDDFRDEGYTSDREEEEFQQSEGEGYTSGQETVVDDGSIDGLSEEDDLPQILKEIEAFGKGEKTPLELLSEALTSWERDS